MKKLKFFFLCMISFALTTIAFAQDKNDVQMADGMRSNGRIYVVVTVIVIILIGLILYLVRLDKKITRLEKENK